jgi:hypothetical protein
MSSPELERVAQALVQLAALVRLVVQEVHLQAP